MGLNFLKAAEPILRDSLLFTTKSPGAPATYLVGLGMMNDGDDLGGIQWF